MGLLGCKSSDKVSGMFHITLCLPCKDLGGTFGCLNAHEEAHTQTHMNKGPCHPSPSPLMSSISFPHSFT